MKLSRSVACLLAGVLSLTSSVAAQEPRPTEYHVKAAYLTNLGRFVEQWSSRPKPSSEEPFDLCVLGQDPFGPLLDAAVRGEAINGAPLEAKRIGRPSEASGCRILFIGSSEDNQLSAILAALGTTPVLTVSDMPDFVKRGGMIQFILDDNHVRFEINIASCRRAGLTLSSELLKLARTVKRTP
jgi:uncharacterized protein DUF4154